MSDSENLAGSGCNGLSIADNSSTGVKYSFSEGGDFDSFSDETATTNGFGASQTDETITIQAALDNGASMLTGIVGNEDDNTTALSNSLVPCIDVGGIAGA